MASEIKTVHEAAEELRSILHLPSGYALYCENENIIVRGGEGERALAFCVTKEAVMDGIYVAQATEMLPKLIAAVGTSHG